MSVLALLREIIERLDCFFFICLHRIGYAELKVLLQLGIVQTKPPPGWSPPLGEDGWGLSLFLGACHLSFRFVKSGFGFVDSVVLNLEQLNRENQGGIRFDFA